MILLREKTPIATKQKHCDGWAYIEELDEQEYLELSKNCKGIIRVGQKNISQTISDGGEIRTYNACNACHDTCCKLELYEQ